MKVEVIEKILVIIIVFIQLWVFRRTYKQIGIFRNIIPKSSSLSISKIFVPVSDLQELQPKDILSNVQNYKENNINISKTIFVDPSGIAKIPELLDDDFEPAFLENAEINIIDCDSHRNGVFANILFSVNNYLIRNRGASTDFNLIKDIVERNANAIEEDINLTIAIPLYLGLMGTMLGIVIGLFNIPDLSLVLDNKGKDTLMSDGITLLIGGVKIAMIASFTGLLLTILNTGWIFKGSRSIIETRKNDFYTFVQIELLPVINQGLASTLDSLQRNLLKFNNEFTMNLRQLSGIFDSNTKAIRAQKDLLDAIDKTKVSEITRYNVKVLQELQIATQQFEKFNFYFNNINLFIENSQLLISKTGEVLARTDNFKVIAENLNDRIFQSQELLGFLSTHFRDLEEHKQYVTNSIAEVGHSISDIFKDLKEHIQFSSDAVKQFTIEEIDSLKKALSESRTNLGNLAFLESLNKEVSQLKVSSLAHGSSLMKGLDDLNRKIDKSNRLLAEIDHNSLFYKLKRIVSSVGKLFSIKKG